MSEVIEQLDLEDGNVLQVFYDTYPESPRAWDNLGIMAIFHNRYDFGDTVPFNAEAFESFSDMEYYINSTLKAIVCLPIYMYEHSGITINTTGFSCSWDSGQVGFIYTTQKKLDELAITMKDDETWTMFVDRLESYLLNEVETMDQYVRGDVYGFKIKNPEGDVVDSCSGFYGSDIKENGILDHIDSEPVNLNDL